MLFFYTQRRTFRPQSPPPWSINKGRAPGPTQSGPLCSMPGPPIIYSALCTGSIARRHPFMMDARGDAEYIREKPSLHHNTPQNQTTPPPLHAPLHPPPIDNLICSSLQHPVYITTRTEPDTGVHVQLWELWERVRSATPYLIAASILQPGFRVTPEGGMQPRA
ncbi:hypothetical protein JTE90_028441 [Oedothorax gibbosus]|uniref:Uncharacterized protein n=1 Tax=Oedothorax gibbosus TaxID=931172 RepID=A0AAV6VFM0_9ARAC|nr:hypothetical protein JTE90_028441 [Oedothorax gibbosus]